MRGLFSASDPADPVVPSAAAGGWNGLSGRAKIGILGGVAVTAIAAIMWPGFNSAPQQQPSPTTQHSAAPIQEYVAAPPVEDVAARVTGTPPATAPVRVRPIPTEMALYTVKTPAAETKTVAATTQATASAAETGLPPRNHATLVRNPDYLIRAGDVILCLPVGHQNSERAGFETCNMTEWHRSTNLRRGLLPPHTRLFGQMRTGMLAGEQRIGIVYSLIQTPNFDMPISSPAGDPLGATGLDKVNVETFFWDRAGAVALYALMDTAVGVGQNAISSALSKSFSNGGTTLNFTGQSQSLAAREFDSRINRPPVGTRDQALPITVIVGQDLDFHDACIQAMRVDPMACPLL